MVLPLALVTVVSKLQSFLIGNLSAAPSDTADSLGENVGLIS